MTYIVVWQTAALAELRRLELAAVDVASFRFASEALDYILRRCPTDMGEGRGLPGTNPRTGCGSAT